MGPTIGFGGHADVPSPSSDVDMKVTTPSADIPSGGLGFGIGGGADIKAPKVDGGFDAGFGTGGDIKVDTPSIDTDVKTPKADVDVDGKGKGDGGFGINLPDIKMPSFGFGGSKKDGKKSK